MPCARWCCDLRRPHAWFSSTLFRKNMVRFWPIWALYGAIWFLILPVGILNGHTGAFLPLAYSYEPQAPQTYLLESIRMGVYLSPVFGILAAMAVFSYLCNPRACGMLHALPIRREGLFLTNYLSGLAFFLLPILGVAVLTLAAQVYVSGTAALTSLFLWAWCQAMMVLFFFSLGVFCAMLTGHLLALPGFYAGLNLLVVGLYEVYEQLAQQLLFGYVSSQELQRWVEWLTPVMCYSNSLGTTGYPDCHLTGLLCVFVYGFVGLVLAGLALLLYRRRALEAAGDVVVLPWLRPLFRWCIALFVGVYLGSFLWQVLFPHRALVGLLLACILCAGALGYFVAEMLLRKTFRVLRRGALGCGCFLAVLTAAFAVLALDLGGYESRVPAPEQVASLTVETSSLAPFDDAGLLGQLDQPDTAQTLALHQAVVDRRGELEYSEPYTQWESGVVDGTPVDLEVSGYTYLSFRYTLTDGGELRRSYRIPVNAALLDDPDTPAGQLEALVNAPGQMESIYFRNYVEGDTLAGAYLSAPMAEDGLSFNSSESQLLLEAVRSDLAAGRLGRHYLMEDRERMENCYFNDLTFTFYPTGARENAATDRDTSYVVTITLQTTASETLGVLEQLGASDVLVSKGAAGF